MEINEPVPRYYPKMSPAQFLEWEREQEYKHEYVDGDVLAMSGASINHNRIASNIVIKTGSFLENKSCEVFGSDLRVSVKWRDSYFYPDVVIACDELEFDDAKIKDTITNPTVIFEILSSSTEDYDIGRKQMYYMQIQSLTQYIIIDSKKISVRVITRREEGTWKFDELNSLDDILFIEPINFKINITELYKGVKF
jgi:Uma2 family endonuclease